MSRTEEVELTNMCMIRDGKGNVLVQNKKNHPSRSTGRITENADFIFRPNTAIAARCCVYLHWANHRLGRDS